MVKHTQTIRWRLAFGLALKGLSKLLMKLFWGTESDYGEVH